MSDFDKYNLIVQQKAITNSSGFTQTCTHFRLNDACVLFSTMSGGSLFHAAIELGKNVQFRVRLKWYKCVIMHRSALIRLLPNLHRRVGIECYMVGNLEHQSFACNLLVFNEGRQVVSSKLL